MAGFAESTTIDEAGASFNDAICADEDGWPPNMEAIAESTTIDEAGASFNDARRADEDGWPPSDAANDDEGRPSLKDARTSDDEDG